MTIFIDDMYQSKLGLLKSRGGRVMKMSHMISDESLYELHEFAIKKLGMKRSWFQGDHYDVSLAVRSIAVSHGAVEVSMRDMACIRALIAWGSWKPGTPVENARDEWRKHSRNAIRALTDEISRPIAS